MPLSRAAASNMPDALSPAARTPRVDVAASAQHRTPAERRTGAFLVRLRVEGRPPGSAQAHLQMHLASRTLCSCMCTSLRDPQRLAIRSGAGSHVVAGQGAAINLCHLRSLSRPSRQLPQGCGRRCDWDHRPATASTRHTIEPRRAASARGTTVQPAVGPPVDPRAASSCRRQATLWLINPSPEAAVSVSKACQLVFVRC